jgi:hypothetical protein
MNTRPYYGSVWVKIGIAHQLLGESLLDWFWTSVKQFIVLEKKVHLWPYISQASLCMSWNWYCFITYHGKAQCKITKTMCELLYWIHEKEYVWLYVHWTVLQFNMAGSQDFPVTRVVKLLISIWNKICVLLYGIHEVRFWHLINLALLWTGMAENKNCMAIFMHIGISHKTCLFAFLCKSTCPSFCLHVSAGPPVDRCSWNLIFKIFKNQNLVKMGQKYQALCLKTCECFIAASNIKLP